MRTRHKGSTPLAQKAREAKQNPQKIPEENLGKIPKQLSHQPTLPASEQLDMIRDNENALKSTVNLYSAIQSAKEMFIRKLEKGERFGTYLKTENGYDITAPEGYVAIQDGTNAVKLVDRLSFSVANFNVEKNWVNGDTKK